MESKRNEVKHTRIYDVEHAQVTLALETTVLVKQKKTNKFSTNFSPIPYTVVRVKGSKLVARNGTSI